MHAQEVQPALPKVMEIKSTLWRTQSLDLKLGLSQPDRP